MDDALMRSLGLLPKRKPRPKAAPEPAPEVVSRPEPERLELICWAPKAEDLFRLVDLQRLDPTGSGTKADRLRHLFGNSGSISDRESAWLAGKGFATGTRYDKWAAYLSVPAGTKVRQAIQKLNSLP